MLGETRQTEVIQHPMAATRSCEEKAGNEI
jgi:hypothetical protein